MPEESFLDLIRQAIEMLLDRSIEERNLIYHVARMENDLRAAIILAFETIKNDEDHVGRM